MVFAVRSVDLARDAHTVSSQMAHSASECGAVHKGDSVMSYSYTIIY